MNYSEIINKIAKEMDLPKKLVDNIYKAYWAFIRSSISILPLKENLNKESFSQLKTNFNIPSLGKLYCTYDRYIGIKKRRDLIKKIKEYAENK